MSKLPDQYAWLNDIGPLPRMVAEGIAMLGTVELPGAADSPVIMGWAREVGKDVAAAYGHDSVPWCGLFMATLAKRAGKSVQAGPLWARNWAKWGDPVATPTTGGALLCIGGKKPSLGDVLVFARGSAGHVALYIAEDATAFHILGGNQGDRVSIVSKLKSECIAVRRPPMANPPASMKPYRMAANGVLSSHEA